MEQEIVIGKELWFGDVGLEIQRLREQLAECQKEREKFRAEAEIGRQMLGNMMGEYAVLREELAECQKERDGLVMALEYVKQSVLENSEAFDIASEALAKLGKTGEEI